MAILLCVWLCASLVSADTERPIIGILTTPTVQGCPTLTAPLDGEADGGCFTAFYPDWVRAGGARPAVVRYNSTNGELDALFDGINGLLFTGGGAELNKGTPYYDAARYLYHKAVAANKGGDHFPIWGTCMGFQLLSILGADDDSSVLTENAFDSEDLSLALDVTPAAKSSRLLGSAPSHVWTILTTQPVTSNLHHDGVRPATFTSNKALNSSFVMLSTNKGRKGEEFVSTMEHKTYPFYATQWHPERPLFEWKSNMGINHSGDAIMAMQYTPWFLVSEARKNSHSFPSEKEEGASLIYNYQRGPLGPSSYQHFQF